MSFLTEKSIDISKLVFDNNKNKYEDDEDNISYTYSINQEDGLVISEEVQKDI